jgi:hypothetical protein
MTRNAQASNRSPSTGFTGQAGQRARRRGEPLPGQQNPWTVPPALPTTDTPVEIAPEPMHRPERQTGVTAPEAEDRLPRRSLSREDLLVPMWITGVHGGAGTSTFAQLLGIADAGRAWPIGDERRPRVLLCARSSYSGLRAAQRALREWAAGDVPVELEGLVLSAAAPKLPKELRPLLDLVKAAAAGAVWEVGWHEQWVRDDPQMPKDRQLQKLLGVLNDRRDQ